MKLLSALLLVLLTNISGLKGQHLEDFFTAGVIGKGEILGEIYNNGPRVNVGPSADFTSIFRYGASKNIEVYGIFENGNNLPLIEIESTAHLAIGTKLWLVGDKKNHLHFNFQLGTPIKGFDQELEYHAFLTHGFIFNDVFSLHSNFGYQRSAKSFVASLYHFTNQLRIAVTDSWDVYGQSNFLFNEENEWAWQVGSYLWLSEDIKLQGAISKNPFNIIDSTIFSFGAIVGIYN